MTPHMEVDRFKLQGLLNIAYDEETMSCGHLVVLALDRLANRKVFVPTKHPRGRMHQQRVIDGLAEQLAEKVEVPANFDVALYITTNPETGLDYYHLGLILMLAGERWLLHVRVDERSRLQREAQQRGLRLEGYYRLKDMEAAHGDASCL